ncbi:MAG: hypothetical protein EBR46_06560 [Betaproteobacteria bacterium]|nr:hypothetical protein [Betaproteobacteria bacterium]
MIAANEASKTKTEYTSVELSDGRTVQFAGKRKVMKETLIDNSKIVVDGDVVQLEKGAISVRFDFLNGETRTIVLPPALLARFAGHGAEQVEAVLSNQSQLQSVRQMPQLGTGHAMQQHRRGWGS